VTVANTGADTSQVASLSLSMKHDSHEEPAGRVMVPRIAPGRRITVRARVPKMRGATACYTGLLEAVTP